MDMFDKPMGGTELMFGELKKRLPESVWNDVSIFNYLPQADFSKKTIFWNQLSYDQEAVQFLKDPKYIEQIDHFVFVSHWQSEMYRKIFNIPGYKTHVIKNACIGVDIKQPINPEKIKICYTSTPWRGLDVLLQSWEKLNPQNSELHVFSSCKIYGEDFSKNDEYYVDLYNKCNELPGVIYRGSISNTDLRKELPQFDILAYPNTFEETSCISVIESLSAGLRVVTSNLGALPETTEGWARMYPYLMDKEKHASYFSKILNEEIEYVKGGGFNPQSQIDGYKQRWSWDMRINEWKVLIDGL
jgi:glycosyltransferase involved in cell wall biosynthesis